ncbi:hypothetical protein O1611_g2293 [Lasiodiplodia mahajangana]|uniref:Uncharacterized protein n=1 Tax=Lasiodiplodia mahajangana TaxID=1108764 RepID=A0ACC2JVG0_9PEZI|nr:hypothetical protein O1611_g2293 [Lasiodiplodia mahajangana]
MTATPIPSELNSQTPAPSSAVDAAHSPPSHAGPGPATGGRFYEEDKQTPSILFRFCPDTSRLLRVDCHEWVAFMHIKCSDVPRLMREGFYWDVSNIIKEEGYIEYGRQGSNVDSWDSASERKYFLADIHQPRRWIARLVVKSLHLDILYDFDVSQLSRKLIRSVSATNQDEKLIYGYTAYTATDKFTDTSATPMKGFNMIYDKMPLEGFWPWPPKDNKGRSKEDLLDIRILLIGEDGVTRQEKKEGAVL